MMTASRAAAHGGADEFPDLPREVLRACQEVHSGLLWHYRLLSGEAGRDPVKLLGGWASTPQSARGSHGRPAAHQFPTQPMNPQLAKVAGMAGGVRSPSPARSPSSYDSRSTLPSCEWCGRQMPKEHLAAHQAHEHGDRLRAFEELRLEVQRRVQQPRREPPAEAELLVGKAILEAVQLNIETHESFQSRLLVIESLQAILRTQEQFCNARVYLFGSCVTGLALRESDTDAAVDLFGTGTVGPPEGERMHLEEIFQLMASSRHFFSAENAAGFVAPGDKGLRLIRKTRVPILSNEPAAKPREQELATGLFAGPRDRAREHLQRLGLKYSRVENKAGDPNTTWIYFEREVELVKYLTHNRDAQLPDNNKRPLVYDAKWDLSARLFGVRNSMLLRRYLADEVTRAAAAAVKMWSKTCGINDPRVGKLSSYSVVLMFVYFLIRKRRAEFIDPESIELEGMDRPAYIPNPKKANVREVGEMFAAFLRFYSEEYDWDEEVITLSRQGITRKAELMWTEENTILVDRGSCVRYHLCIEDPYEEADPNPHSGEQFGMLNVTRKITEFNCLDIRNHFYSAYASVASQPAEAAWLFR